MVMRILSSVLKIVQRGGLSDATCTLYLLERFKLILYLFGSPFVRYSLPCLADQKFWSLLCFVEGVKSSSEDAKLAGTDGEAAWWGAMRTYESETANF